ncbi:LysR family transcriptional regulator [Pseudorhodoplanes sp.]|uniref:LysR family transcriptional regulator n=1 Tax=Pseudorhodoplanes sp. TaxID=1934341 RepID=UPI003D105911
MNFRDIEAFYWTAALCSFSRAADRLDTSQPTISARIKSLESVLAATLFERCGREIRLTAAGREMYGWAERILSLHQIAEHAVSKGNSLHGVVRLGVSETLVHTWLPEFVQTLRTQYPNLSLELNVDISPHLRDDLLQREIDLAFLLGPVSDPSLQNQPLTTHPLALVASPKLGLADRIVSLEELSQFPIITYARRTLPTVRLVHSFRTENLPQPRLFASSSLSANIKLAQDAVGVAILPPVLVTNEIALGQLKLVDTTIRLDPLHFTATYSRTLPNPLIAAVAQIAVETADSYQES